MEAVRQGAVLFAGGQLFSDCIRTEEEIAQGADPTLAAPSQAGGAMMALSVGQMVYEVITEETPSFLTKTALNITSMCLVPITFVLGTIRNGKYEALAGWWNQRVYSWLQVPSSLGERTVSVLSFVGKHLSKLTQLAFFVEITCLAVFGHIAVAVAAGVPLIYKVIDSNLGLVPRKLSLFIERTMPLIANTCLLFSGDILLTILSTCKLAMGIEGTFGRHKLQHMVDKVARSVIPRPGRYSLEQCDAPLASQQNPSADEIRRLLLLRENHVKVNPGHFTKEAISLDSLPSDENFEKLLSFFDQVDWTEHYDLMLRKLRYDNQFRRLLRENFGTFDHTAEGIDNCVRQLAGRSRPRCTKEEYLQRHLRHKVDVLVNVLLGQRRVAGSQQQLDDAIKHFTKIVGHLEHLRTAGVNIDFVDMLLEISVNAGDYCADGILRTSADLVSTIVRQVARERAREAGEENPDGLTAKAYQVLVDARQRGLQAGLQALTQTLGIDQTQEAASNHLMRDFTKLFGFGFVPESSFFRNWEVGMELIIMWEYFANRSFARSENSVLAGATRGVSRNTIIVEYERNIMQEMELGFQEGELYALLSALIDNNTSLSEEEKEALLAKIGGYSETERMPNREETLRALLVMLGVYQVRPSAPSLEALRVDEETEEIAV